MAARNAREAVLEAAAPLRATLACVTRAVVLQQRDTPSAGHFALQFAGGETTVVGHMRLRFRFGHYFTAEAQSQRPPRWTARTTGYEYELRLTTGPSLLAYHWHPVGRSPITWPHLHLRSHPTPLDLTHARLPTGVVPLAALLHCAITELGVEPLRADWAAPLAPASPA